MLFMANMAWNSSMRPGEARRMLTDEQVPTVAKLIEDALLRASGNQAQAARLLGLSYHQFRYFHGKYAKGQK